MLSLACSYPGPQAVSWIQLAHGPFILISVIHMFWFKYIHLVNCHLFVPSPHPPHFLYYVFITLIFFFVLAFWNLSSHGCRTMFRQWVSSCRFEQFPISSMLLCRSWNSHLPKHQHLLVHHRSPASLPFV